MLRAMFLAMALAIAGLACGERDAPVGLAGDGSSLQTAGLADDIRHYIDQLFPKPNPHRLASYAFEKIVNDMGNNNQDRARRTAVQLILFTLQLLEDDMLLDPEGPDTTEDGVAKFFAALLQFVELTDGEPIPPEVFDEDGAFQPCGPQGCLIVTDTGFAGVRIPRGALDHLIFIGIRRLPDDPPPLDTDLDQYPLFYDFFTYPEESPGPSSQGLQPAAFDKDILVGLCVVDPPDPQAPDPDIVDQLRLAHPDGDGGIEILPLANAGFLDCGGATTESEVGSLLPEWLSPVTRMFVPEEYFARRIARIFAPSELHADPGNLGARASSFSPFAAVDTESGDICTECEF